VKRRGEKGVTLIEVAVVMAIVAIMGLFMAPAIGEWIDNYRIRQAARQMSADLQLAKMKAIAMGQSCAVVFNQDGFAYVIFPDYDNDLVLDTADYTEDLDGDGKLENETDDIIKRASLNRNVVFDTAEGGGNGIDFPVVNGHPAVAFNPKGMPRDINGPLSGTAPSIFLQNTKNNKGRQVTISLAGRISTNEY